MSGIVYTLCTSAALFCAWLLMRAYFRTRYRLLLWGGLCFFGLTLNNALVVADKLLFPDVDLFTVRLLVALASMLVLLYGMIWESE